LGKLDGASQSNARRKNRLNPHSAADILYRVANGDLDRVFGLSWECKTVLQLDPQSGVPLLTAREHQVLQLVAQGLSAKEVAQEIDIAPRTVERHIENVRLKIRARNRTHMVTLAVELGLLVLEPEPMSAQIQARAV